MKKKLISALLIAAAAITLISCGNSKESNKETAGTEVNNECTDDTNNEADDKEKVEENKKVKNTSEKNNSQTDKDKKAESKDTVAGKKDIYKGKLDEIQKGLSDLDSYYAGSTVEMKYAANEEYERWDKALNEIYGVLKGSLSSDKMSKLEKEEQSWIKEKESKAQKAAEEYKGGTAEGLQYTASLAQTTKERCYELVEKYMN